MSVKQDGGLQLRWTNASTLNRAELLVIQVTTQYWMTVHTLYLSDNVSLLLLGSLPFCSVGVEHKMSKAVIVLAKLMMPDDDLRLVSVYIFS